MRQKRRIDLSEISGKETILKECQHSKSLACWLMVAVHTFAMSSVFLNSPSMSVTFPSLSNSVHRSFSSFAAFPALLRPRLVPPTSSKNVGSGGRLVGFVLGLSLCSLGFNNLLNRGQIRVDACRLALVYLEIILVLAGLCALALSRRFVGPYLEGGHKKSRFSNDDSTVAFRDGVVVIYLAAFCK